MNGFSDHDLAHPTRQTAAKRLCRALRPDGLAGMAGTGHHRKHQRGPTSRHAMAMDLQQRPTQPGHRWYNTRNEAVSEGGKAKKWLREFYGCTPEKIRRLPKYFIRQDVRYPYFMPRICSTSSFARRLDIPNFRRKASSAASSFLSNMPSNKNFLTCSSKIKRRRSI